MSSATARPCFPVASTRRAQSLTEPGFPWTKTAASVASSGPASSVGERTPPTITSPCLVAVIGLECITLGVLSRMPRLGPRFSESVEILGATRARLHHAPALVDLGAALRRANHRKDA